jgi:Glycosyl hydrolase family 76
MRKRALFFLIGLIGGFFTGYGQTNYNNYLRCCDVVYQNIYRYFYNSSTGLFIEKDTPFNKPPHSFLWPLCGLVQAANEMERLHPDSAYLQPVIAAIRHYYSEKAPAPGYHSYVFNEKEEPRFYDDNQWLGLAYMDAYNRKKDNRYLEDSEEIYRFMMTGFDTIGGGGLYWKEGDRSTKNTCSNGPGILLALQLYRATRIPAYLDTALLLYNWTNQFLLAPEGVYDDALKLPSKKIDKRKYTYNTGTMLQSNVLLYQITRQKKYLTRAQQLASASLRVFYRQGRFPENYWFNAVLMRGYEALYEVDKNKKYLQSVLHYIDMVWKQDRDKKNLVGEKIPRELLDQAGVLELLARAARLKKEGF